MAKNKQQWLGLYADQAAWLKGVMERIKLSTWAGDGDFIYVEEISNGLDNLSLLYPRRPSSGRRKRQEKKRS